ncbi:hypothetical protein D3C71_1614590 [compost metagenome]
MKQLATPPARNTRPTTSAGTRLTRPIANVATKAPARVPNACARNGNTKCAGPNSGIAAFRPSVVLVSTPAGGGTSCPPSRISPMFTALPTMKPSTTASNPFKNVRTALLP